MKDWFANVIRDEVAKRGGGRGALTRLAEEWKIPHSQLSRWSNGTEPNLSSVELVLQKIGGDVRRALPDWGLDQEPVQTFPLVGAVSAGTLSMADESAIVMIDVGPPTWKRSYYWSLTQGRVVFLEVDGISMSPRYPAGSLIACRAPIDFRKIPDNAPVVIRHRTGGHTFKTLKKVRSDLYAAEALNSEIPTQYFGIRDFDVEYLVLGSLNVTVNSSDKTHLLMRQTKSKKPTVKTVA